MAPVVLPVSPMPATAVTATAHGVSAMPPWLPMGDHKCQGLRSAPVVLCRAMPCHFVPHQLLALPAPKAVPGSVSCPAGAASACLSPFLPRLISRDLVQGARTTSGPGPCKRLSRVSCQLFAYNCRTVLRSSLEGPVRGHRVTTSRCQELPQGHGAGAVPVSSPQHRNAFAVSGPTMPGLLARSLEMHGCNLAQLIARQVVLGSGISDVPGPSRPPVPLWSPGRAQASGQPGRHQHGS